MKGGSLVLTCSKSEAPNPVRRDLNYDYYEVKGKTVVQKVKKMLRDYWEAVMSSLQKQMLNADDTEKTRLRILCTESSAEDVSRLSGVTVGLGRKFGTATSHEIPGCLLLVSVNAERG